VCARVGRVGAGDLQRNRGSSFFQDERSNRDTNVPHRPILSHIENITLQTVLQLHIKKCKIVIGMIRLGYWIL
jgi:hypothetical protein